jgi:hypothetical protein
MGSKGVIQMKTCEVIARPCNLDLQEDKTS